MYRICRVTTGLRENIDKIMKLSSYTAKYKKKQEIWIGPRTREPKMMA